MTLALLLLSAVAVHPRGWADAREPFHVVGNVYSVGSAEVTSFLIATPKGHVLIDGGFPESGPQIARNIDKLGFKLEDVKVLLVSHAHFDHAGGLADLKRRTGAQVVAICQGETINAPALSAMFRQIIANNRAGGWRKLKRES